jgi:hypothetical protein
VYPLRTVVLGFFFRALWVHQFSSLIISLSLSLSLVDMRLDYCL